jgi:hypothetical protein
MRKFSLFTIIAVLALVLLAACSSPTGTTGGTGGGGNPSGGGGGNNPSGGGGGNNPGGGGGGGNNPGGGGNNPGGGGGGNTPGGGNGGDDNYRWVNVKQTTYAVSNEIAVFSFELEWNWITHRYTSDTNYELKYEQILTYASGVLSKNTIHHFRDGQNSTFDQIIPGIYESSQILKYDMASGLILSTTVTTATGTTNASYTVPFNCSMMPEP